MGVGVGEGLLFDGVGDVFCEYLAEAVFDFFEGRVGAAELLFVLCVLCVDVCVCYVFKLMGARWNKNIYSSTSTHTYHTHTHTHTKKKLTCAVSYSFGFKWTIAKTPLPSCGFVIPISCLTYEAINTFVQ